MTVKELIEQLKEMPQDFPVEIGTLTLGCGEVARVIRHKDCIELESNEN